MAAVRSDMLVVVREPLFLEFAFPPVFRFDLLAFDRTLGSISERTEPAADGGAFEEDGIGECAREEVFDEGVAGPGIGERAGVLAEDFIAADI